MANNRELSQFANVVGYNGGNIGIGNTIPVSKLTVGDNTTNATAISISSPFATAKYGDLVFTTLGTTTYNARIRATVPGNGTRELSFITAKNASENTVMTLDGDGQVGIGTNNPALRAHIFSTANADAALIESTQNFATLRFKSALNTSGPTIGIDGAGGFQLDQKDTSKYIAFAIGSERLRITSTGEIQIKARSAGVRRIILSGSPSNSAFNIEAHDGATGASSGDVQGKLGLFYNDGSTLTNTANISFERGSGAADGAMVFVTNQTERLRITSDGSVGIGTDNPTMPLQLSSTEQDVVKWVSSNSDGPITHYYNGSTQLGNLGNSKGVMSSSNLHFGIGSKSDLLFGTKPSGGGSTVERLRITSDGDVIITSTASPVSRAKLDVRMRSDHPGFNITHNDGSFYRHLGTVGPGSSDGSTGRYLHIRLRTVWNDLSMTMFRITGYYPYNVYGESYFGCYRYSDVNYRYIPFGQVISNQGNKAIIDSAYNTNANPGYLVIVCDWNTTYNGLMIEHYGAGGSYGSYMQHDLEIIDTKRSTNTSAQW